VNKGKMEENKIEYKYDHAEEREQTRNEKNKS
jgi:hypothetical protein